MLKLLAKTLPNSALKEERVRKALMYVGSPTFSIPVLFQSLSNQSGYFLLTVEKHFYVLLFKFRTSPEL